MGLFPLFTLGFEWIIHKYNFALQNYSTLICLIAEEVGINEKGRKIQKETDKKIEKNFEQGGKVIYLYQVL